MKTVFALAVAAICFIAPRANAQVDTTARGLASQARALAAAAVPQSMIGVAGGVVPYSVTPASLRAPLATDDSTKGYLDGGMMPPLFVNGGSGYTSPPTATVTGTCAVMPTITLSLPTSPGPFAIASYTPGSNCTTTLAVSITGGTGGTGGKIIASPWFSEWLDPSGTAYQLIEATAGSAIWQPLPPTKILDLAGTAPQAAFGVCKMGGTGTTQALTVQPVSGSPQTGWTAVGSPVTSAWADNGCVDPTSLDQPCAASSVTACKIVTIYDLTGNGYNWTCAAPYTNCPDWTGNLVGTSRAITMDGIGFNTGTGSIAQTITTKYALNSAISWNLSVGTFLFYGQCPNGGQPSSILTDSTGATGLTAPNLSSGGNFMGLLNSNFLSTTSWDAAPSVFGFVNNGAAAGEDFVNNAASPVVLTSGSTLTGMAIGNANTNNSTNVPPFCDLSAGVIYASALSPQELAQKRAALHRQFASPPQRRNINIIYGDSSLTRGSVSAKNILRVAMPQFRRPMASYNLAVSGNTIATVAGDTTWGNSNTTASIQSQTPQVCAVAFCSSAESLTFTIEGGPNDIRGNSAESITQIYTDLQTASGWAKAHYPNSKIVIMIPMIQTSINANSTYQTEEKTYFDLIRLAYKTSASSTQTFTADGVTVTGGLSADVLADLASDPFFGPGNNYTASALSSATCGVADHILDACLPYPAAIYAAAINATLPTPSTLSP